MGELALYFKGILGLVCLPPARVCGADTDFYCVDSHPFQIERSAQKSVEQIIVKK